MHKPKFNEDFEINISLGLDEPEDIGHLTACAAQKLGVSVADMPALAIKKRSIDARRHAVQFVYTVGLYHEDSRLESARLFAKKLQGEPVIIIGGGPAGLFCAYELATLGIKSIICERGKKVQERRRDLKGLNQHGVVNEDSNYCFGEGGAGTYSDGKLYTRSHKRGSIRSILEILVAHGANPDILINARPHIGSNKLPKVITALRETLESVGVEFLFDARVSGISVDRNRAKGVVLADGREIMGQAVVVATGHSARDIYSMLHDLGAELAAKPFALGVRIEHRQSLINQIQYGRYCGHKKLPPAYYRLAYTPSDGRGAFSFCMCPGGWIVPAATTKDALVVNGMSLSKRDSPFANSGFVVAVSLADLERLNFLGPLGGIELQNKIEMSAQTAGGGKLVAPATRVKDFLADRLSRDLPETSYIPGLKSTLLHEVLDSSGLVISARLKEALHHFNKSMPGYICDDAVMIGVETRTSSPTRIVRDKNTLCSNILGLYPCGEGAGYAGGIISAALDGINVASSLAAGKVI